MCPSLSGAGNTTCQALLMTVSAKLDHRSQIYTNCQPDAHSSIPICVLPRESKPSWLRNPCCDSRAVLEVEREGVRLCLPSLLLSLHRDGSSMRSRRLTLRSSL